MSSKPLVLCDGWVLVAVWGGEGEEWRQPRESPRARGSEGGRALKTRAAETRHVSVPFL